MPKNPTDHKLRPKTAYGWGADAGLQDLVLPSGATVQVRSPDPQRLIGRGLLDEFDGFTPVAAATAEAGQAAASGVPVKAAAPSIKAITKQLRAMDRVVCEVVVQPTVVMAEEDAVDGAVWVDGPGVTLADKTFIVQHATGGTADLATFRLGPAGALAGVPDGP